METEADGAVIWQFPDLAHCDRLNNNAGNFYDGFFKDLI
jgi:hypothetical protein